MDLNRIANVIRGLNPDVVALQEVDRNRKRTGRIDQAQTLAGLLGMSVRYAPNLVDDEGEYGIATLTRHPIVAHQHVVYPSGAGWEPRGLLEVTIDVPHAGRIAVLNTHFQVATGEDEDEAVRQRRYSSEYIAERVERIGRHSVLMGDFNADPCVPELVPLHALTDAWAATGNGSAGMTFPASPFGDPASRIDAIFVSGGLSPVRCSVVRRPGTELASDHYPVVAEVALS